MRRLILFALCLFSVAALAQNDTFFPEPTQRTDGNYRIFRTKNIHMMLKLDTRTGQIWETQWSLDDGGRFTQSLNSIVLVPVGAALRPGRFTLVPTENIYTFILLDQEDGRAWQAQWGDAGHSFILPIPSETPKPQ
jgi:hypothetical protein